MQNTASFFPVATSICAFVLLVLCAYWDIRYRRIPNWATLPGAALGLGMNGLFLGWQGMKASGLGLLVGFGALVVLFVLGWMGGGDVKLMAAIGAIVGPSNWFWVFILSNILGGLVAVVLLLSKGRARRTFSNVGYMLNELAHLRPPYAQREELDLQSPKAVTMPHGFAIAIGSFVFLAAGSRHPNLRRWS